MNFLEIIKEKIENEKKVKLERFEKPLPLSDFIINRSGIIGEFKRGTPKRKFKIELLPEEIALIYEKYNFSAISVVVESQFFLTTVNDLKRIKSSVSIPVIQKGFILRESQIIEARNNGADSILLIVRLLDRKKISNLLHICHELHMEPLVEVFSEEDVGQISDLPVKIVGINNRDLSTLEVDLENGEKILSLLNKKGIGNLKIIESGLRKPEDLVRFKRKGADGFLIGSAFLEDSEIEKKAKEFSEVIEKWQK